MNIQLKPNIECVISLLCMTLAPISVKPRLSRQLQTRKYGSFKQVSIYFMILLSLRASQILAAFP